MARRHTGGERHERRRRAHDHVLGVGKADHGVGREQRQEEQHQPIVVRQLPRSPRGQAAPREHRNQDRRRRGCRCGGQQRGVRRAEAQAVGETEDAATRLAEDDGQGRRHHVVGVEGEALIGEPPRQLRRIEHREAKPGRALTEARRADVQHREPQREVAGERGNEGDEARARYAAGTGHGRGREHHEHQQTALHRQRGVGEQEDGEHGVGPPLFAQCQGRRGEAADDDGQKGVDREGFVHRAGERVVTDQHREPQRHGRGAAPRARSGRGVGRGPPAR